MVEQTSVYGFNDGYSLTYYPVALWKVENDWYSCENGSCVANPNGVYPTEAGCLAACNGGPTAFTCDASGACVPSANGQYKSSTGCHCYDCVDGVCGPVGAGGSGAFASAEQCQVGCGKAVSSQWGCGASGTCVPTPDGPFATAGDCACISCNASVGTCGAVNPGDVGKFQTWADCGKACSSGGGGGGDNTPRFGCGADGTCVQQAGGAYSTATACQCYECVNNKCGIVSSGGVGSYGSLSICSAACGPSGDAGFTCTGGASSTPLSESRFQVLNKGTSSEGSVFVYAQISGMQPAYYLVDSGYSDCVFFSEFASKKSFTDVSIQQLDSSWRYVVASPSEAQVMSRGGIVGPPGASLGGIMGVSFLQNFTLGLDFDTYTMTLRDNRCQSTAGEKVAGGFGGIAGYMYYDVQFNSGQQRCFLDLGSSISVLSTTFAAPAGYTVVPPGTDITTMTTSGALKWTEVTYASVSVTPQATGIRNTVWLKPQNKSSIFESGALGYSFLSMYSKVFVNFGDASMVLVPRPASLSATRPIPRAPSHMVATQLGSTMIIQSLQVK